MRYSVYIFQKNSVQVKQQYQISTVSEAVCVHRQAKSCPLVRQLPSLEDQDREDQDISLSNLSSSEPCKSHKAIKNGDEAEKEEGEVKKPPTLADLTVMVQNFLEPLHPLKTSLVGKNYRDRMLGMSVSAPGKDRPHIGKDNSNVFRHKSFYLTT